MRPGSPFISAHSCPTNPAPSENSNEDNPSFRSRLLQTVQSAHASPAAVARCIFLLASRGPQSFVLRNLFVEGLAGEALQVRISHLGLKTLPIELIVQDMRDACHGRRD